MEGWTFNFLKCGSSEFTVNSRRSKKEGGTEMVTILWKAAGTFAYLSLALRDSHIRVPLVFWNVGT